MIEMKETKALFMQMIDILGECAVETGVPMEEVVTSVKAAYKYYNGKKKAQSAYRSECYRPSFERKKPDDGMSEMFVVLPF